MGIKERHGGNQLLLTPVCAREARIDLCTLTHRQRPVCKIGARRAAEGPVGSRPTPAPEPRPPNREQGSRSIGSRFELFLPYMTHERRAHGASAFPPGTNSRERSDGGERTRPPPGPRRSGGVAARSVSSHPASGATPGGRARRSRRGSIPPRAGRRRGELRSTPARSANHLDTDRHDRRTVLVRSAGRCPSRCASPRGPPGRRRSSRSARALTPAHARATPPPPSRTRCAQRARPPRNRFAIHRVRHHFARIA
jgi:hypothetical protein